MCTHVSYRDAMTRHRIPYCELRRVQLKTTAKYITLQPRPAHERATLQRLLVSPDRVLGSNSGCSYKYNDLAKLWYDTRVAAASRSRLVEVVSYRTRTIQRHTRRQPRIAGTGTAATAHAPFKEPPPGARLSRAAKRRKGAAALAELCVVLCGVAR